MEHFRPRLMPALLRVAAIGCSRERTVIDDFADLSDVVDYEPPVVTADRGPGAVRVLREPIEVTLALPSDVVDVQAPAPAEAPGHSRAA